MSTHNQGANRKVRSINPGTVYQAGRQWKYTVRYDGHAFASYEVYDTANAAKQAMREEVARLRKKHCV